MQTKNCNFLNSKSLNGIVLVLIPIILQACGSGMQKKDGGMSRQVRMAAPKAAVMTMGDQPGGAGEVYLPPDFNTE